MTIHRAGPVRSEEARISILRAAAQLLQERGYEHLTMEGIAHEAGVGKQTIYRWWPSKSALIAECLLAGYILPERLSLPSTGALSADLTGWLDEILAVLLEPSGEGLIRSLIAVAAEDAEVGKRLAETFGGGSNLEERLQRAIDDGDLRADAPISEISEALVGTLMIRALSRTPSTVGTAERIVRAVLEDNRPR